MKTGKKSIKYVAILLMLAALGNEITPHLSPSSSSSSSSSKEETPSSQNEQASTNNKEQTTNSKAVAIVPSTKLPRNDYRICRVTPTPVVGEPPVKVKGVGLPIWYQCAGKPYDEFMYKVYGLISQKYADDHQPKWGRRNWIVPPPSDSNSQQPQKQRKILILGNSHTRQVTAALLCHYKNDLNGSRPLIPVTARKNVAMAYRFPKHHLLVYVIVNHPFVYSTRWHQSLEKDILKHPLDDLDAILLGTFNGYRESRGTTFLNTTLEYQRQFPHQGVDFVNIPPPTLADLAKVYQGPLIWISMFAHYNVGMHKDALATIAHLSAGGRRTNLRAVNGRNYIEELGGAECSSNVGETVSTCVTDRKNVVYKNGHRCCGDKGGQPDLIAWDVVEALHHVLSTTATTTTTKT